MRYLLGLICVFGCSDYQVHKTSNSSQAGQDDSVVAFDTGEFPLDTGEPLEVTEEEPPVGEEPPDIDVPDEPVYLHTGETLYSWDPESGMLSIVGNFFSADGQELEYITDIAIDNIGRFYGVSHSTLYGINAYTAEVWPLAPLDFPLFGLTCTSDGLLVGGGDGLYAIDTLTGAASTIVPEGRFETSGDMVGLPDGLLYWAVREDDGLVVVDPNSGVVVPRGIIGVERIYGLGYANGALYGFTEDGLALEISPTTGEVLNTMVLPGAWYGATTNPVLW